MIVVDNKATDTRAYDGLSHNSGSGGTRLCGMGWPPIRIEKRDARRKPLSDKKLGRQGRTRIDVTSCQQTTYNYINKVMELFTFDAAA